MGNSSAGFVEVRRIVVASGVAPLAPDFPWVMTLVITRVTSSVVGLGVVEEVDGVELGCVEGDGPT